MPDKRPITLAENNDETLLLTITRKYATDDLTTVTAVEVYLKTDQCQDDGAAGVLRLSSTDPSELVVTSMTADAITAEAYVPAAATTPPYDRWWHADVLAGAARRTAMYGPVQIIDL